MIPPVNPALIPGDVRRAGGEEAYEAALGFESMLLDRLTEDLVPVEGPHAATVGDAFGEALLQGGGIGLAEDLYRALKR